jgi:hypothetical protein
MHFQKRNVWSCIGSPNSEADDVPPSSDLEFADTVSSTITLELPVPDEDEGRSLSSDDEGICVGGSILTIIICIYNKM